MSRSKEDWEDEFKSWKNPPSNTEEKRMEETEKAIKAAIAAAIENGKELGGKVPSKGDITTFAKGSYKADTNIRKESDVDICVQHNKLFLNDYPEGRKNEDYGHPPSEISYSDFKDWVGDALVSRFGKEQVRRGTKAFDVFDNSKYKVNADVLPAFTHRRYLTEQKNSFTDEPGIVFLPDGGDRIINWPKQEVAEGIAKNGKTSKRYKRVVRIVKNLQNDMNMNMKDRIPSFLIECMVWNVSNNCFGHERYYDDVKCVTEECINKTASEEACSDLKEINDIKHLFGAHQKWTRKQAYDFFTATWDHVGFAQQ